MTGPAVACGERAVGADQLIVDDVRRHAHERQVLALMPDDFVAGGERNQVREALEGDGVAVVDEFLDGVSKLKDGSQRSLPAVCAGLSKTKPLSLACPAELAPPWVQQRPGSWQNVDDCMPVCHDSNETVFSE